MTKGMGNILKQAQKLQAQMLKIQEELANKSVEFSAAGGMVKVAANGRLEILSITIDPEVVNPDDVTMLEDLLVVAVNGALKQAQEMASQEMSKLTGGLSIPGLM
jgi:DNA-binding YbaB/EbfC family protein